MGSMPAAMPAAEVGPGAWLGPLVLMSEPAFCMLMAGANAGARADWLLAVMVKAGVGPGVSAFASEPASC